MNRTFRTVSAFMRHTWCIEPVYAEQHLPLINAYLNGQLSPKAFDDEDDEEDQDSHPVSRIGYAVCANANAATSSSAAPQTRYALDDPDLPEGSVFVLDIRGVIVKESTCCSTGTEVYCAMLEAAYTNEKIIGNVLLVDSPGGMLSGTPTLHDKVGDPRKPTVTLVNEGLMASAGYWLACKSDFIYASQKTDQIGSIGVYLSFKDSTEKESREGIRTISIYSDRSSEKNKPYKDALAGDEKLIKEDLNQAADLFWEAVVQGRGDRLKPAAKDGPDVSKGGLFYAGKAIELGLIDGYTDLAGCIAKVVELHQAKQSGTSGSIVSPVLGNVSPASPVSAALQAAVLTADELTATANTLSQNLALDAPTGASTAAPVLSDTTPAATQVVGAIQSQSQTPNPSTDMFGFVKLAALAAIQGVAADAVTDEQITALNAELPTAGYNVAVISQSQFAAAQTLQADLNKANSTIAEKDKEIERLGKQPGTTPSQAQKDEEPTGSTETTNAFVADADNELVRLRGGKK